MNNRFVISYSPGNTPIHKMTGRTKVITFLILTVFIIGTYDLRILLPLFTFCLCCVISMKPNWKPIIFMVLFMTLMAGVIGSSLIFIVTPHSGYTKCGAEHILWRLSNKIYFSAECLWYAGVMFFKRLTSLASAIAFVLAITPSELAAGLNRIRLPYKVCIIISLAFRTIPNIVRDYNDIKNSMQMRGVEMDGKRVSLGKKVKATINLLIPLIVSSFGKIDDIANSMDLRSFGKCKGRTWYSEHEETKYDRVAGVVIAVLGVTCLCYVAYHRLINPPPFDYWCPWVKL